MTFTDRALMWLFAVIVLLSNGALIVGWIFPRVGDRILRFFFVLTDRGTVDLRPWGYTVMRFVVVAVFLSACRTVWFLWRHQ